MAALDVLSDHELWLLLREGDHGAYKEVYHRYQVLLYIYAFKKLKDKEAAKDLVQELFLNLWNKRDTLHIEELAGYLYRWVRNRAFDIFAHRKVEQKYVDSLQVFLNTDTATTYHLVRTKDVQAMIDNEIASMPKGMREVFELSRSIT